MIGKVGLFPERGDTRDELRQFKVENEGNVSGFQVTFEILRV